MNENLVGECLWDYASKQKRIGYYGFISFIILFFKLNWKAKKMPWADKMQFTVTVPMKWFK